MLSALPRSPGRRSFVGLLAVLVVGLVATACSVGTTSSGGSRHKLYDTIADLAADSSRVLVVQVVDRRNDEVVTEPDGTETSQTTTSDVTVLEVLAPASLGATIEAPEAVAIEQPQPGELVGVVQTGSLTMAETPAPLLVPGATYLLFLSATSEQHEGAWWVTGGNAGIFRPDGDAFTQVAEETGDSFPTTITRADLR